MRRWRPTTRFGRAEPMLPGIAPMLHKPPAAGGPQRCYYPVAYTNVSPASAGSWQDVDLSALIASGASGVALHFVNTGATDRDGGWRKKGSTDDRKESLRDACQAYGYVGVDGSRFCQVYIGHAELQVWLVGYFNSNVVFFTNGINVTPGTTGSFQDVDITGQVTGGDTAIAAILEHNNASNQSNGFRKNGSTDNRTQNNEHNGAIVGLDAGEIFEANVGASSTVHLLGYVRNTAHATFYDNGIDRSLGSTGAYADLAALPAGAIAGLYEAVNGSGGNQWSIRKKGASHDHYKNANLRHGWALVECDGSRFCEAKIASTSADFFEMGWFGDGP